MKNEKDAYYFSHDANAKDDPKMIVMMDDHGLEAYGIYWILVETLRNEPSYSVPLAVLPGLAKRYGTTPDKVKSVVLDYGLFSVDKNDNFFSPSLLKRMDKKNILRSQRSIAGKKGNEIRWSSDKNKTANNKPNNELELSQSDDVAIANYRKERKGKERKGKEEENLQKEVFVPDFEDQVLIPRKPKTVAVAPRDKDLESFETAWVLYGRKGNKKPSMTRWLALTQVERKAALAYIPIYLTGVGDKQYTKDFERYLSHMVWVDKDGVSNGQFPWPSFIPIHDAFRVAFNNTQRVDCDFPHEASRKWFMDNQGWEKKYGGRP